MNNVTFYARDTTGALHSAYMTDCDVAHTVEGVGKQPMLMEELQSMYTVTLKLPVLAVFSHTDTLN